MKEGIQAAASKAAVEGWAAKAGGIDAGIIVDEHANEAKLFSVYAEPLDPSVAKMSLMCRMQGFGFDAKETFNEAELGGVNNSSLAGNPLSIIDAEGAVFHHGPSCIAKWVDSETHASLIPLLPQSPSIRILAFLLDFYVEELLTPALKVYRFGSSSGEQELRSQFPTLSSRRMERHCWLNRQKRQLKLYGMHESNKAVTNAHVQRVLFQLDKQIRNSGYLSGSSPGYIDVTFYAPIYTFLYHQSFYQTELEEKFPALVGWLKNLENAGKLEGPPREFISLSDPLLQLLNIIKQDCSSIVPPLLNAYKQWLVEMEQELHSLPAYIGMCTGVCMQQKMTRVVSVDFLWHMERITTQLATLESGYKAEVEALLKGAGLGVLFEQVQLFQHRKLTFRDGHVYLESQPSNQH